MPLATLEVLEANGIGAGVHGAGALAMGFALDEAAFRQRLGGVWEEIGEFKRTRMHWGRVAQIAAMARAVIGTGVKGDYAEFGTWRGGSLYAVAHTWREMGEGGRALLGFDSFEGLPRTDGDRDGPRLTEGQFADVDVEEVRTFFAGKGLASVRLVKGWFDATVEKGLEGRTLALAHIDCDTLESTRAVIGPAWERLSPGGFLVVDDYGHPDCAGVTVALEEFFARREETIWQTPMPESAASPGMNCSCWVRKGGHRVSSAGSEGAWEETQRLRDRLVGACAELCAARGYRRIALYGAGKHTERHAPGSGGPWEARGVGVVAVLDDEPKRGEIDGVRVVRPRELKEQVDAVVVSSDRMEALLAARAREVFGGRVPVMTIYGDGRAT